MTLYAEIVALFGAVDIVEVYAIEHHAGLLCFHRQAAIQSAVPPGRRALGVQLLERLDFPVLGSRVPELSIDHPLYCLDLLGRGLPARRDGRGRASLFIPRSDKVLLRGY